MFHFFKKKLPSSEELFVKYLAPWYPEEDRPQGVRPDMYQIAAYEGEPLCTDEIQYLAPEYLEEIKTLINETMSEAALEDFTRIYKTNHFNLELLDAVDKYYNREKIAAIIKESDPANFSNTYLVTVCEFGVMLGQLFNQLEGFEWLYSHPYYHSIIVHSETGFGITVFDWAVKKFSEYGVEDGFVAKYHAALHAISGHKEEPGR